MKGTRGKWVICTRGEETKARGPSILYFHWDQKLISGRTFSKWKMCNMSMVEERGLVQCSSFERSSITEDTSVLSGQEMEMAALFWEVAEWDEGDWAVNWWKGVLSLPWVRQKAAYLWTFLVMVPFPALCLVPLCSGPLTTFWRLITVNECQSKVRSMFSFFLFLFEEIHKFQQG